MSERLRGVAGQVGQAAAALEGELREAASALRCGGLAAAAEDFRAACAEARGEIERARALVAAEVAALEGWLAGLAAPQVRERAPETAPMLACANGPAEEAPKKKAARKKKAAPAGAPRAEPTPGEWSVAGDLTVRSKDEEAFRESAQMGDCDGVIVADLKPALGVEDAASRGRDHARPETLANGRLICAAKDFYDAATGDPEPQLWGLRWVEDVLEAAARGKVAAYERDVPGEWAECLREARVTLDRLRAAVQKVRGP